MSHTKRKQHYSADFKREAVALVTEQNYSVAEAAAAVGASANNLRRWKQVLSEETSGARLTPDERAELHRLRRENKQLQMEREILKKASTFFAKEKPVGAGFRASPEGVNPMDGVNKCNEIRFHPGAKHHLPCHDVM